MNLCSLKFVEAPNQVLISEFGGFSILHGDTENSPLPPRPTHLILLMILNKEVNTFPPIFDAYFRLGLVKVRNTPKS